MPCIDAPALQILHAALAQRPDDGTEGTIEQYAHDVTAFLMWAAEPHLEAAVFNFNILSMTGTGILKAFDFDRK